MAHARFVLSAFGDEIADDLATQLDVLASEGVHHLEFRGAWGQNILDLDAEQLGRAAALLQQYGFGVSAIGSPIGKSELSQPLSVELGQLDRAIAVAESLNTRLIRIFSFYIPDEQSEHYRDEVLRRMRALTERAAAAGMILLHENEKDIYGDTPERCLDMLMTIDSPTLRMAFDPANFVQVGVAPMARAWPLVGPWTTHIHVKDALFSGEVRPAGEGDGAVGDLLAVLAEQGYQGFLTIEPHLEIAGPFGGFSGELGMRTAVHALRRLLDDISGVDIS